MDRLEDSPGKRFEKYLFTPEFNQGHCGSGCATHAQGHNLYCCHAVEAVLKTNQAFIRNCSRSLSFRKPS